MSRTFKCFVFVVFVFGVSASLSAQALGDVARKERTKQKPQAARTYTNEDIPAVTVPKEEPKPEAATTAPGGDGAKDAKSADKTDADKQATLNAEWKAKVADAKKDVASFEREVNLMQREEKLKVAVYYNDAGNRLRDDKAWAEQEKKYQEDLAARQKDLAGAKEKLDAVRESARKAGATSVE